MKREHFRTTRDVAPQRSQSRCATGLRHTPNSSESLPFFVPVGPGIEQVLVPSVAASSKSVGSAPRGPNSAH